uniref:Bardet-Biedl syndrome 7 protein homolog n=1 Tax=Megaselia scalaris TaxID=36166 RepID=T1GR45_MEGSC
MELELTRIDYGNIGTSSANCLKLIPNEYKKQQKVVVGDLDGSLQFFSIKKSEAQIAYQSYVGKKVACIQLGGAPGTTMDKVFVATDNVVKGYNKKGKMFLSFDTNLTENIKCMYVSGTDLITCGNHVYSHYRDCKDVGTYLCGDTIVDVVALCQIIVLRVLEHCRVRQTIELESVPTVLHVPRSFPTDRILCGFADGKVSIFYFGNFTGDVKQEVLIKNELNSSAITCLDTYDLDGEGKDQLIIGRRDGTVQIYTMPMGNELDVEPRQIYKEVFPESISAIQAGCVYSNGFIEIVVLSYNGSIFGLTTQVISVSLSDKEVIKKIVKRPDDTNAIESQVIEGNDENQTISLVKPKENYKINSQLMNLGVSSTNLLDITSQLNLSQESGTMNLFLEIPYSIETVTLQSEVSLELAYFDKSIGEIIDSSTPTGYQFSAKITLKTETNRFEANFQTIEGQYGNQDRPYNTLSLKGSFSLAEIHNWLEQCIPEIPEKLGGANEPNKFYFKNVLIGSLLECKFSKGQANFKSDNLTTISILKDFLTKEATKKRIKLEISPEINNASIPHILKLVAPKIIDFLHIRKELKFLRALRQVDIKTEEDFNCLMPEYQSILNRAEEIEAAAAKHIPTELNRYFGILTDYYIDCFKFKGIFVKDRVNQLLEVLDEFELDKVIAFFNNSGQLDSSGSSGAANIEFI